MCVDPRSLKLHHRILCTFYLCTLTAVIVSTVYHAEKGQLRAWDKFKWNIGVLNTSRCHGNCLRFHCFPIAHVVAAADTSGTELAAASDGPSISHEKQE